MYSVLLALHILAGVVTLCSVAFVFLRTRLNGDALRRLTSATSLTYLAAFQIATGAMLAILSSVTALSLCDNLLAYSVLVGTGIAIAMRRGDFPDTTSVRGLFGSAALFLGSVVLGA